MGAYRLSDAPREPRARSVQIHLLEQRLESGMPAQRGKEEGPFDPEDPARSLLVRTLQPIHCSVVRAETGIDVGHVIRGDISLLREPLELSQYFPGLISPARAREGLAELSQVQRTVGTGGHRP